MTAEQLVAILTAFAAVFGALAGLIVAFRSLTVHLNSRMDQLLELTATSAIAEGRKMEHDITHPGPPAA